VSSISNVYVDVGADDENSHGKLFPEVSLMRYLHLPNPVAIEIDEDNQDKMQMSLFSLRSLAFIPSLSHEISEANG